MRNIAFAAWVGAALLCAGTGFAQEKVPVRIEFSIEQQPLRDALRVFARQAGMQVLRRDEEVSLEGMTAPSVAGAISAEEALERLLANTGLRYEFVNDRTVRISKGKEAAVGVPKERVGSGTLSVAAAPTDVPVGQADKNTSVDEKGLASLLEEIVVTGTHIRGIAPDSSPLMIYGRETIERSGAGTVEEFMRKVPQNFGLVSADSSGNAGSNQEANNNSSHGAAVNLRGLGAGSTLVLLNGHRLAPGDSGGSYVDISMIPLSAVESIQVLTDGASAIYGADAVAGVVNFILRKNFSGAETAVRYGAATRGGAEEVDASQILGTSWDAGNAMLVYEHRETEAVRASQRSFIPDTSGFLSNTIILPNQRSDSAFLTGRQELSPATAVYADTFFSRRNFIQDQAYPGFLSHGTGETKQYGVVLGLTQNLWGDWRGDLAGNYSKVNQGNQLAQFADFFPPEGLIFSTEVDTRLLSLDLRADGSVFAAPGGMARMSLGSSARREEYALTSSAAASVEQQRKVASVYGELFVPLIGIANSSSLARRLELSLATRYEHYDDFGSSFNPKIGVLWAPIEGLNLRSSYATSFRAPSLQQLADANRVYFYLPEGDLSAPDGATNTLIFGALGNPALDAEKSRSYTFGFDFRPAQLQGFALSATYFNIDYRRRIANPPLIGDLTQVFDPAQVAALAPFIDRAPDPAELVRIFAEEQVIDLFGVGAVASDVEAIFDQRLHNIARAKAAGFDVGVDYTRAISQGELGLFLNGDYILHLDSQPASATPSVRLAGTIYNPAKLRLRSGASWSWRGFSSTFSVNYTDDYENNYLTPAGRVASWTTADLQLGYRTGENGPGLLRGLSMTLNAQNLTDRDPPVISGLGFLTNFGYDATNASALGRVLTAQLTKRW